MIRLLDRCTCAICSNEVGQDNLLHDHQSDRSAEQAVWYIEAFAEAMLRLGALCQFVEDTTWSVETHGDATEEAGMDTPEDDRMVR